MKAYLESRVLDLDGKAGRKELDEQWKALRRGWYIGRESFAEKLKEWLAAAKHDCDVTLGDGAIGNKSLHAGDAGHPQDVAPPWQETGKNEMSTNGVSEPGTTRSSMKCHNSRTTSL